MTGDIRAASDKQPERIDGCGADCRWRLRRWHTAPLQQASGSGLSPQRTCQAGPSRRCRIVRRPGMACRRPWRRAHHLCSLSLCSLLTALFRTFVQTPEHQVYQRHGAEHCRIANVETNRSKGQDGSTQKEAAGHKSSGRRHRRFFKC